MNIRVGCDVVNIRRFETSAQSGGEKFLENVFSVHELSNTPSTETLAGMFAAKEAVTKALGILPGQWKNIEITKKKDGRPEAAVVGCGKKIASRDISISHDGDYAFATAVFLINEEGAPFGS